MVTTYLVKKASDTYWATALQNVWAYLTPLTPAGWEAPFRTPTSTGCYNLFSPLFFWGVRKDRPTSFVVGVAWVVFFFPFSFLNIPLPMGRLNILSWSHWPFAKLGQFPFHVHCSSSYSVPFSSVALLYPTLGDPMDCNRPGFPARH